VKSGKSYKLSFRAKSTGGNITPNIQLMKIASPWTSYAAVGTATIASDWTTYTVNFTSNTTDPNARITFFLDDKMPNGSKLYLDSLSFTESIPEVNTVFTYDDLGRPVSQSEANGITKSFAYDAADNRKSFVLKQNNVTKFNNTYEYDKLNRLYKVYDSGNPAATYLYDANGNRDTLTYPNGITTSYLYNLQNKVTTLTNKKGTALLSDYAYTYYADGNQESYKDLITGKSSKYEYDDLRRLAKEIELKDTTTASTTIYTYDDSNNRDTMTTTRGETITSTSYQYTGNRLDTETRTVGNTSLVTNYGYDDNGNLLTKSLNSAVATTSTYDALNQLQTYTEGNVVSSYTYNDIGLRISKNVAGNITNFVLDGQDVIMETDAAGSVKSKFIRGINLIAFDDSVGTRKYYLFNAHGDVVQLTDASGNVVTDYSYDGFGNRELLFGDLNNDDIINMDDYLIIRDYMIGVITDFPTLDGIIKADVDGDRNIDSDDLAYIAQYNIKMIKVFPADNNLNGYADENEINITYVDANPFRYCGEYFDKETGSIYLRARYYNPSVGRFISEDSYWGKDNDPLSLNLYTYCYSDPINNIDPTGHFVFGIIPIIVGTAPEWVPVVAGVITTGITAVTVHETVVKPIINEYRDSTGAYTTNKPIAVPKPNDAPKPTPKPQPKNNSAPKVVVSTQTKDEEPHKYFEATLRKDQGINVYMDKPLTFQEAKVKLRAKVNVYTLNEADAAILAIGISRYPIKKERHSDLNTNQLWHCHPDGHVYQNPPHVFYGTEGKVVLKGIN
jgi:RHS repeat-associated protein